MKVMKEVHHYASNGLCCTNTLEALYGKTYSKTFAIGRLIENVLRIRGFSRFMQQSLSNVQMQMFPKRQLSLDQV